MQFDLNNILNDNFSFCKKDITHITKHSFVTTDNLHIKHYICDNKLFFLPKIAKKLGKKIDLISSIFIKKNTLYFIDFQATIPTENKELELHSIFLQKKLVNSINFINEIIKENNSDNSYIVEDYNIIYIIIYPETENSLMGKSITKSGLNHDVLPKLSSLKNKMLSGLITTKNSVEIKRIFKSLFQDEFRNMLYGTITSHSEIVDI